MHFWSRSQCIFHRGSCCLAVTHTNIRKHMAIWVQGLIDAAHRHVANGFVFTLLAFPKFEYKLEKRSWNSHWIWHTSSHNSVRFDPEQLCPTRLMFFNWLNGKAMYRLDAEAVAGSMWRHICNEHPLERIIYPLIFLLIFFLSFTCLLKCNFMSLHLRLSIYGTVRKCDMWHTRLSVKWIKTYRMYTCFIPAQTRCELYMVWL